LPDGFEPDRITSDTPLPPVFQADWDKLLEIWGTAQGIVKGRDRAVRLFVKSSERARIIRNAGHYVCTDAVKRGFKMGLDNFVGGDYRDYDTPETPTGMDGPLVRDDAWRAEREQDEARFVAELAEQKSDGKTYRPRDKLPFEGVDEYEEKKAAGRLAMVRVEG